jgi:hypothetical protein
MRKSRQSAHSEVLHVREGQRDGRERDRRDDTEFGQRQPARNEHDGDENGMPAIGEPRWRAAGVGHVVRLLPGDVCLRGECIHRLGAAERVEQHVPNSPR